MSGQDDRKLTSLMWINEDLGAVPTCLFTAGFPHSLESYTCCLTVFWFSRLPVSQYLNRKLSTGIIACVTMNWLTLFVFLNGFYYKVLNIAKQKGKGIKHEANKYKRTLFNSSPFLSQSSFIFLAASSKLLCWEFTTTPLLTGKKILEKYIWEKQWTAEQAYLVVMWSVSDVI